MIGPHLEAVEKRLTWLRWIQANPQPWNYAPSHVPSFYRNALQYGETYFMDRHFCELVDHARRTVPHDLAFDRTWLQSPSGFVWLAIPFHTPHIDPESVPADIKEVVTSLDVVVNAVGWHPVKPGSMIRRAAGGILEPAPDGMIQFCCFVDYLSSAKPTNGFGAWSYYALCPGDVLRERLTTFERAAKDSSCSASYEQPADATAGVDHPMHEVRWVFTALYMMAQRLTATVHTPIDRATRRRAERNNQTAPELVRVITLRRLVADRKRDGAASAVDWQWTWGVRGHWRNQFYPVEGVHKPKFIESYIKGPENMPLKPSSINVFLAKR